MVELASRLKSTQADPDPLDRAAMIGILYHSTLLLLDVLGFCLTFVLGQRHVLPQLARSRCTRFVTPIVRR